MTVRGTRELMVVGLLAALCGSTRTALAQGLRFDNRRDIAPPDYATLRVGPFYSSWAFSQTAGYRYTRSRGTGTDFLFNNERGVIKEDGWECPLVSTLTLRNYLLVTRHMDLDISAGLSYGHFPRETQEDYFDVNVAEEGLTANLSTEVAFSEFLRGTLYDNFSYATDFIDRRGILDELGGFRYERLDNTFGADMDWLMGRRHNLGFGASRRDVVPRDDQFEDQEVVSYREQVIYEFEPIEGLILGASAGYTQNDFRSTNRSDNSQGDYRLTMRLSEDAQLRLRDKKPSIRLRLGYSRSDAKARRFTQVDDAAAADGEDRRVFSDSESDQETVTGGATVEDYLTRELSHKARYDRELRGGFDAASEIVDRYGYEINWDGDLVDVNLYTYLDEVRPSRSTVNDYSDWRSGVRIRYPLLPYIVLSIDSEYAIRDNEEFDEGPGIETAGAQAAGPVTAEQDLLAPRQEQSNDYETWRSSISTSFALTKKVDFRTSFQHWERYSDLTQIAFERDTFSALLTFSHQF